jgi:hypothetical protein
MTRRAFILCAIVVVLSVTSTAAATRALVTSKDIKNGTIQTVDLSAAAKKALKGKRGLQGPAGAQGVPGERGPAGFTSVTTATDLTTLSPDSGGVVSATCSVGKLIGGGFDSTSPNVGVYQSSPTGNGNSWQVSGYNFGTTDNEVLRVYALCAG